MNLTGTQQTGSEVSAVAVWTALLLGIYWCKACSVSELQRVHTSCTTQGRALEMTTRQQRAGCSKKMPTCVACSNITHNCIRPVQKPLGAELHLGNRLQIICCEQNVLGPAGTHLHTVFNSSLAKHQYCRYLRILQQKTVSRLQKQMLHHRGILAHEAIPECGFVTH